MRSMVPAQIRHCGCSPFGRFMLCAIPILLLFTCSSAATNVSSHQQFPTGQPRNLQPRNLEPSNKGLDLPNKLHPVSLQSRYANEEVKEVMIQPSLSPSAKNLVKWQERPWLNHVMATSLTLAILGVFAFQALRGFQPQIIWYCIFGFLYLAEAAFCSTRRYLSNVLSPAEVLTEVQALAQREPEVRWELECYHYNPRMRRNNKGHRETSNDKVVTHRAKQNFRYNQWRDLTDMERLEQAIEYNASRQRETFLKVTLVKLLMFASDSYEESYRTEKDQFLRHEGNRDTFTSMKTFLEVQGFKPKLLAVRTAIGGPGTGRLRLSFFWLFTFLGLTVPYRVWFERHCDRLEVVLTKEVTA